MALRVIADHIRAVSFSIADGQIPSNNKGGYVIRRILRRAVRYGYTNLDMEEPFLFRLVPVLAETMGNAYPELRAGKSQISKVTKEEETAFLRTLGKGLKMIEKMIDDLKKDNRAVLPGKVAFELYDTFGFPVDLTQLILRENNMMLDSAGFEAEMKSQKERSREDATMEAGDWIEVRESEGTEFTGYEKTEDEILITKYRKIRLKGKETLQLIFNRTPFYAESGGQVGDTGYIASKKEKIVISDTIKENNLIIHISDATISDPSLSFYAVVDLEKRLMTANNHSATHLLHFALRRILGKHVEQKGSLVTPERLRFDFSHFSKLTDNELSEVESMVNKLIRESSGLKVTDGISMEEARSMGAMALFGEKYGEKVRVVRFGESVELCGGTHVRNTGNIGIFKIVSEGAVAAGIRRIEAVTAAGAEEYINSKIRAADEVASLLKSQGKIRESVEKLIAENNSLRKTIEKIQVREAAEAVKKIQEKAIVINGITFISGKLDIESSEILKTVAFNLRKGSDASVGVLGSVIDGKASLVVIVSDKLVKERNINAINIIKEISPEIKGGGGGQPFIATAGGKNPDGIPDAILKAEEYLRKITSY